MAREEREPRLIEPSISGYAIIGTDDRFAINPASTIVHLSIVYSDNARSAGTGFMISSNTVMTAGHLMYGGSDYGHTSENHGYVKTAQQITRITRR